MVILGVQVKGGGKVSLPTSGILFITQVRKTTQSLLSVYPIIPHFLCKVALGENSNDKGEPIALEAKQRDGPFTTVCTLRRNHRDFQRVDLVMG